MAYRTIDGDISDFFDASSDLHGTFETADLRAFLLNQGHTDLDARDAVLIWQQNRFERVDGTWKTFRLTDAGLEAVSELVAAPRRSHRE
jgi:hypothetical protein